MFYSPWYNNLRAVFLCMWYHELTWRLPTSRHTSSAKWSCACLFRVFHPPENFNSYVILLGEGLQILTYARHSWPLSSEGSLACHTYCGTGHPFITLISKDPWNSYLLPSVWQWSCSYPFLRLRFCFDRGSNLDLPHTRRTLYLYATVVIVCRSCDTLYDLHKGFGAYDV